MPAESVPFIIAILAMFGVFMGVVGTVSILSYLPERKAKPASRTASVPSGAHPA
jgi:hypothetical protein